MYAVTFYGGPEFVSPGIHCLCMWVCKHLPTGTFVWIHTHQSALGSILNRDQLFYIWQCVCCHEWICLNTHSPIGDWLRLGNVLGFRWHWTWVPWPRITPSELKKYLLIISRSMGKCVCYIASWEGVYMWVCKHLPTGTFVWIHSHQSGTDPGWVMSPVFADVELESPVEYTYKRGCMCVKVKMKVKVKVVCSC